MKTSPQFQVFKGQPSDGSSLLNDMPLAAQSAITYAVNDLGPRSAGDSIPDEIADLFNTPTNYRELQSLQAVMKSVSHDSASAIFSHMLISSNDLPQILDGNIVSELMELQKDVTLVASCVANKLS